MAKQVNLPDVNLNTIGCILFGLALAFLVDNVALDGAVTNTLPKGLVVFVGLLIFIGFTVYGFKLAKRQG
jgi:F0F1-type ATP synthase assembly protein I